MISVLREKKVLEQELKVREAVSYPQLTDRSNWLFKIMDSSGSNDEIGRIAISVKYRSNTFEEKI